jgi:hypothetical protein
MDISTSPKIKGYEYGARLYDDIKWTGIEFTHFSYTNNLNLIFHQNSLNLSCHNYRIILKIFNNVISNEAQNCMRFDNKSFFNYKNIFIFFLK